MLVPKPNVFVRCILIFTKMPINQGADRNFTSRTNTTEEQMKMSIENLLAIEPPAKVNNPVVVGAELDLLEYGNKGLFTDCTAASEHLVNSTEVYPSTSTAIALPFSSNDSSAKNSTANKLQNHCNEQQPQTKSKPQERKRRTNASKKANAINAVNQKSTIRNKRESKVQSPSVESSGISSTHPNLTFNTSPFRARSNVLLSPKEYSQKDNSVRNASDVTPPKAHCNSRAIYSSGNSPEVIDFSGKSSGSGSAVTMHPEVAVQGESRSNGARKSW